MKRLTLLLTGACMIMFCFSFKSKIKINPKPSAPASKFLSRYTLNGIPYMDAKAMVQNFSRDGAIYDSKTSVYFNRDVFHSMDSVLNTEVADGFRVYFAKTPMAGNSTSQYRNTIVIVSTFDGGPVAGEAYNRHQDYFQYNEPYLYPTNLANVNGITNYDTDNGGALLYTNPQCGPDNCSPVGSHYVSCKKAQNMVNAYANDAPLQSINSTNEWFDIKIINSLDSVLQINKSAGLRIYFAKHEKIDDDPDENGDYLHCFLLITTLTSPDGIRRDNFICMPVAPKIKNNIRTKKGMKKSALIGNNGGGGTDNGEQCPTNCTGATLP